MGMNSQPASWTERVLVQTGKGIGDSYLPDVGSKTTSFSSAIAGIFASKSVTVTWSRF